jgi:4-hydroxythreonine-4-phosphate dehydrogenase
MNQPAIAITMGDAAGIGPELIVKLLAQGKAHHDCNPFVVGDPDILGQASRILGSSLRFRSIQRLSEARFSPPDIDILCPEGARIAHLARGKVDPAMGQAAALCLRKAFEMAIDGQVQGVVSAPLNKEEFHRAGYAYLDELAYLADLTGSRETFILGVMGSIWTVAVTEHVAFKDIAGAIKTDRVRWAIVKIHDALRKAGNAAPRIAVAALNPHAGEGGLFGREELDEIGPAIRQAQSQGINAQGPVPADMVFVKALQGEYDGVVCMYHDQANIARKLQPKRTSATLFMGLPVVCGTTAHGTAFDIAGQGVADPGSLEAALKYTVRLSPGTAS